MSLITIDTNHPETETRFMGVSFDLKSVVTQYMQSYKGKDVARFKVHESYPFLIHKPKYRGL